MYNNYYLDKFIMSISYVVILVSIAVYLLSAVCYMGIFRKAEKPMWAAFVPFYNSYILNQITFGNGLVFIVGLLPFIASLFNFGDVLSLICNVLYLMYSIFLASKLASVFDRSKLFAVGLFFLPFIFYPILGFGNSYYCGLYASGGSFLSTGRSNESFQSNYYQRDYRKNPVQNSYDTYTGNSNSYSQNDGFFGQSNTNTTDNNSYNHNYNSNNDFYYQSGSTQSNGYNGQGNFAGSDNYYGQNSTSDYYTQGNSTDQSDSIYGQSGSNYDNNGYYGQNNNDYRNNG